MKMLICALLLFFVSCDASLNTEARAPAYVLDLPKDVQSWRVDRPNHRVAVGEGIKLEVRSRLSPDSKSWTAAVESNIRDTDGLALAETTQLTNGDTLFKCDSTLTGARIYTLAAWANGYGYVAVCGALKETRESDCVSALKSFKLLLP